LEAAQGYNNTYQSNLWSVDCKGKA